MPTLPANPYRRVHEMERRRQRRAPSWVLPLLAAAIATPLARPVLLSFLEGGDLARGIEAISFRLGAVVASAMAIATYSDLVRGPDRPVLDPHPIQPVALLGAVALRTARQRAYLPAMCAILLVPVGLAGHWSAWAGAVAVVMGGWLCALGVGFTIHLGGVWAACSPRLAAVLDFLRGENPRLQAALIYAPGVAVLVVGVAVALAAGGLGAALDGWMPGWAWLLLPPAVGLVGWALAPALARRWYVRASALLAEIDAMWAGSPEAEAEEARRVYLEWVVKGAGPAQAELLRALRQGWRRLRTWPMGAWGLGAVGALAGWSGQEGAEARALAVCAAGVLAIGAVPSRMAEGDPVWLDLALGVKPGRVGRARALAAWLYAQGALLPALLAVAVRHGPSAALELLIWVEPVAALGAFTAAALAARWRGRSVLVYGPIAVVLWAGVLWAGG